MFGEIAPQYDRLNHLLSMNVDRYWRWLTVRRVKPNQQDPILDVCTGTGDLAFAFANYTKGMAPIVATDFCPEMLDIGRKKKSGDRLSKVEFLEADAQNLPFDSDKFQVVSVAFGLRNVADTDRGLAEMTRVCKPGGKVAVLEFSTPAWEPFRSIYLFYFHNILPRIGRLLSRNKFDAYKYLPDSVGEFPSGKKLADSMQASGLKSVDFFPLTGGIATLYVGVK